MDTFEYTANSLYSGGKIQRSKAGTDTAGTRKLKIFCIILLAILIIISGTMGALFYTLMKRIDATEKLSDDLQSKSGHLTVTDSNDIFNTKWEEIERKIEANKAKYETDFQVYLSKITQLEKDGSSHISQIQDHSSRITLLEKDKATDDDKIQNLDARISQLEIDGTIDQRHVQSLNNSLAQLASDIVDGETMVQTQQKQITQLEADRLLDQVLFQVLNTSFIQFESNRASDQAIIKMQNTSLIQIEANLTSQIARSNDHSSRLAGLETERASDRAVIEMQNTSLIQLETNLTSQIATSNDHSSRLVGLETMRASDRAVIEMQNTSLIQLETNLTSQIATSNDHSSRLTKLETERTSTRAVMEMQNNTLMQLEANLTTQAAAIYNHTLSRPQVETDMEIDRDSIRNLSSRMSIIETYRQTDMSAMEANSGRLSQLEHYKNETYDFHQALDSRLTYLEDELVARTNSDEDSIVNNTIRIQELELNRKLDSSIIQGQNTKLFELEMDVNATRNMLQNTSSSSSSTARKVRGDLFRSKKFVLPQMSHITRKYVFGDFRPDYKSAFTVVNPVDSQLHRSIQFTTAVTNIGSHYDTSTGQFTCEYPGIYVFTVHIHKDNPHVEAKCYIRQNGSRKVFAYAWPNSSGSERGVHESSNTVVLHLSHNDNVDVGECSNADSMDGHGPTTSFTGFLLKAD